MGKLLFASLALMAPMLAFATPEVGDKVVYDTYMGRQNSTVTKEIVSNLGSNEFTVHYTTTNPSFDYNYNVTIDPNNTQCASAQSIEKCKALTSRPDELASIETIKIANKDVIACHISTPGPQDWWYGDVPFCLIKKEINPTDPNGRLSAELSDFVKL